jgi:photosystem II stability/assembly factor-like uncharacterized protein
MYEQNCFFILLLVWLTFGTTYLNAQVWQSIGLENQKITSLAIDPNNINVLYAGSGSDFSEGTHGRIFKTTNGGVGWDTILCCLDVVKILAHPDSSNILYAAIGGANLSIGGVIKTTDAGLTWYRAESGILLAQFVSVAALAIDPKRPEVLYAGTVAPNWPRFIYKTTDGGKHWERLNDTTGYSGDGVTAITVDPENTDIVYVGAGARPKLLKTVDGGNNWFVVPSFPNVDDPVREIELLNSNFILAGNTSLFKSTDGGDGWTEIGPNLGRYGINSIVFFDTSKILFSSYRGIWKTENGGSGWEQFNNGLNDTSVSRLLKRDSSLYATTATGVYTTVITTDIKEREEKPSNIHLFHNFPNPFNSSTIISYLLPTSGHVQISIYDLLGREVVSLVKENQIHGHHTIYWDGTDSYSENVSSGVYLYKLYFEPSTTKGGAYTTINKLLLIR